MKRRNAEGGKLRRTLKRNKIPDSIYGSLFMYFKFFLVWLLVLMADFILEFRFEYLWPFWLLLRSVYDSFKYQGLAFSVFFVCIALTSDMICFLFIPIHWLFFAASTYVWVQFVWHTERGICLPTVSLWLLFVYIEACVRLKELKSLPFHLDLCRPFAAHCIGYPVVTLGFGFKSYVGYRIRQRKQKEVAKENDFYTQLLMQALPQEPSIASFNEKAPAIKATEEVTSNGVHATTTIAASATLTGKRPTSSSRGSSSTHGSDTSKFSEIDPREAKKQLLSSNGHVPDRELEYMENQLQQHQPTTQQQLSSSKQRASSVHDYEDSIDLVKDKNNKANGVVSTTTTAPTRSGGATSGVRSNHHHQQQQQQQPLHVKDNKENVAINIVAKRAKNLTCSSSAKDSNSAVSSNHVSQQRDDHALRLESDIKRLKADLQASRQVELEFRSKVVALGNEERLSKSELSQLQQENDNLHTKLHGLMTSRQHEKHMVASLEKKLQEERKSKAFVEMQLLSERKAVKKLEEAVAVAAAAAAVRPPLAVVTTNNTRSECTDTCKARRRDLEQENKQLRREYKMCEERFRQAEREAQTLHQYKESHNESEVLVTALTAMQDKNTHLESSLSAETRLKLDLFCALGEAKRQLEITQSYAMQKEKEVEDLKSRVAEVMAVMPPSFSHVSLESAIHASPHYTSKFVTDDTMITASTLDPNASVYTPKCGPAGHLHHAGHHNHVHGSQQGQSGNGAGHLSPLGVVDM